MCELFGVSSPEKIVLNDSLKKFFSNASEHPNGWGMAFFCENSVSVEKQPENAANSIYLKQRLRARIEADYMMAHIRLATKGCMDYENTHPFVLRDNYGRTWTFEHNGTIFESEPLNKYAVLQQGQTDSERIIMYIVERINAEQTRLMRPLDKRERFKLVESITAEITPGNKVNFLLFDGELLYAHSNFRGSLHYCEEGRGVLVSTRALDFRSWQLVPLNTLLAFEAGELAFKGDNHGNEYFFSEEQMKLLFLDYAAL